MGATGSVVSAWAGEASRVVEFGTRFTSMVVVPTEGSQIEVTAVVKAIDAQAGRVTLDVTTTSAGSKVLGRCTAVVRLD